ncbi:uncharacterized protein [Neodiprion pinetum]|uniref:uncharacterized protein n=1 Tax=Neodiprion pinetum TaxID=441929 RepID=UPI00371C6C11
MAKNHQSPDTSDNVYTAYETDTSEHLCLLPSKSSLHIHGKIAKDDGVAAVTVTKLINMAVCHLFEEVRYELNGVEIDRNKNVGITCTMKGYVSLTLGQQYSLENTGWLSGDKELTDAAGNFDVVSPLNYVLCFAEDYRRVIVNAKHELILTRFNTDLDAVIQTSATENFKITLNKIERLLPYIKLVDKPKIQLLNYIAKDPAISMSFRSWETYVYPMLPSTTRHIWSVMTSTQLEKPRYVVLGFQTARRNEPLENAGVFDHCRIRDVKLFLNSQCYPYGNMNLDNETLKTGPVDIRLECDCSITFPPHTSAYCMILDDRIVEYNLISSTVKKLI